jgi:hypothetical protein
MTQKAGESTSVNCEGEEKSVPLEGTSTPKPSRRRMRGNLLATWQGTQPLLLAILDKAQENGVEVIRQNVLLDGAERACIILPSLRWMQEGKFVTLAPLEAQKDAEKP